MASSVFVQSRSNYPLRSVSKGTYDWSKSLNSSSVLVVKREKRERRAIDGEAPISLIVEDLRSDKRNESDAGAGVFEHLSDHRDADVDDSPCYQLDNQPGTSYGLLGDYDDDQPSTSQRVLGDDRSVAATSVEDDEEISVFYCTNGLEADMPESEYNGDDPSAAASNTVARDRRKSRKRRGPRYRYSTAKQIARDKERKRRIVEVDLEEEEEPEKNRVADLSRGQNVIEMEVMPAAEYMRKIDRIIRTRYRMREPQYPAYYPLILSLADGPLTALQNVTLEPKVKHCLQDAAPSRLLLHCISDLTALFRPGVIGFGNQRAEFALKVGQINTYAVFVQHLSAFYLETIASVSTSVNLPIELFPRTTCGYFDALAACLLELYDVLHSGTVGPYSATCVDVGEP